MYVYMYVYVYMSMCVYVCTYVCVSVCMYVYVCIRVCMYVFRYVGLQWRIRGGGLDFRGFNPPPPVFFGLSVYVNSRGLAP